MFVKCLHCNGVSYRDGDGSIMSYPKGASLADNDQHQWRSVTRTDAICCINLTLEDTTLVGVGQRIPEAVGELNQIVLEHSPHQLLVRNVARHVAGIARVEASRLDGSGYHFALLGRTPWIASELEDALYAEGVIPVYSLQSRFRGAETFYVPCNRR